MALEQRTSILEQPSMFPNVSALQMPGKCLPLERSTDRTARTDRMSWQQRTQDDIPANGSFRLCWCSSFPCTSFLLSLSPIFTLDAECKPQRVEIFRNHAASCWITRDV